ncbi:MAG: replication-associated recombination protein A [Bacilli bacterium]|nr:replication-associated recombination protein A [Bacilli bacterium]
MEPLAVKIRPKKINDIVGQEHIIGENGILNKMIISKKIMSMILSGNPGIGKTTIAFALCNTLNLPYFVFNASIDNKAALKKIVDTNEKTNKIVIIDELHRMKKDVQDYLLPIIEEGLITMIGITTVNPYYSVNPAIRSRCILIKLKDLNFQNLKEIFLKGKEAIAKEAKISEDAIEYLINLSNGDARSLLNNIELIFSDFNAETITIEDAKKLLLSPTLNIDKNEDNYYDTLSGLQKSIRGSDVHASLHYLAKLLFSENLLPLTRRLYAICYEDIGLANPSLGPKVKAAIDAALELGFPEARLPLSVIVIEMALSPKSNSAYLGISSAIEDLENGISGPLPIHLKIMSPKFPNQKFYQYPHDFPGAWIDQQYLPEELKNKKYYIPKTTSKYEELLKERYEIIEKLKNK